MTEIQWLIGDMVFGAGQHDYNTRVSRLGRALRDVVDYLDDADSYGDEPDPDDIRATIRQALAVGPNG